MTHKHKDLRTALSAGEFDFGQKCCERGQCSGNPSEPPECCGQPLSAADDIRSLLVEFDAQAAEIERLREAITEYLEAQDAVDNNEYLFSPEKYGKLNLRRRAARDDLDAALSGETV